MLRYVGLMSSALASKTINNKIEKLKLKITSEILNEVTAEFPETK